ncbi:MAG TPA: hypothetical protein DCY13_10235 [Verrucomicrobiales bacterium]|nr:hypothetical protein [Verrucomicrobiales bacterium]
MKKTNLLALVGSLTLSAALTAPAQSVPEQMSYQGHVAVNGTPFSGNGNFKFALIDPNGPDTLWSNDGTGVAGGEPVDRVVLPVTDGMYSVALGNTTLSNMTSISPKVFNTTNVHLRIWFDDGVNGSQQLTPDQPILSVGYAMMAQQVPDGSITTDKLAGGGIGGGGIVDGSITASDLGPDSVNSGHIIDGEVNTQDIANLAVESGKIADVAVTTAKLADDSVTSAKLANSIDLGSASANGYLNVWSAGDNISAIELNAPAHRVSTFGSDGKERVRLWGDQYGQVRLHDDKDNTLTAWLSAGNDGLLAPQLLINSSEGNTRGKLLGERTGGSLSLFTDGGLRALLETEGVSRERGFGGGKLTLYQGDGNTGAILYGDDGEGVGALSLRNVGGNPRARIYGGPHGRMQLLQNDGGAGLNLFGGDNSGSLWLYNATGNANVGLWSYDNEEGVVTVRNKFGNETVYLWGRDSADVNGGQIGLKEADGTETLTLQASEIAGNGAQIVLRKSDGTATIVLDADQGGDGRITTQVLQITGGSDLSEGFEIQSATSEIEPGMVVSIDPEKPGQLVVSQRAYDRTAAGVVSGAGGVNPGMVMGQTGSIADGKHPVALTGRVYCKVDASFGAIRPGDLITTSDTPGHGMRVGDHDQAQGAIIGKAMTRLDEGTGLVLVLVSLQ